MKFLALLVLSAALLTSACGNNAAPGGEKVFRYGTPAYGIANENAGMDPHEAYQGWSAIRYGVGETLFKFDDAMQPQPWLAEKYEFINENTVKITLKDNIYFTSGNKMTGAAVKACLEDLISRHNRARVDLKITGITAEGKTVTITSAAKVPVLINYLCDPYGCIIDMSRGTGDDTKISGTGPFMVESLTPKEVVLVKNPAYYGGVPKTDRIIVSSITDGDGYVDKDGQPLTLRWLTYSFRQELPLLAEASQSWLKETGIRLEINPTDGYADFLRRGEWDIYAKAFVTAPTGDAQYYFTTHVLKESAYNSGNYYNPDTESLIGQLGSEFSPEKRTELAAAISRKLVDGSAFAYIAHLKMTLVMKSTVQGFAAHPCDYYEITKDLSID